MLPYFAGGISYVRAEMSGSLTITTAFGTFSSSSSGTDTAFGGYVRGGFAYKVSEKESLGLDARYVVTSKLGGEADAPNVSGLLVTAGLTINF